jgi:hypothetical protein
MKKRQGVIVAKHSLLFLRVLLGVIRSRAIKKKQITILALTILE